MSKPLPPIPQQPISQQIVNQIASDLLATTGKALSNRALVHADKGEGNLDAATLVATTNLLAQQLLLRGVDEQSAVNALVTTMRTLKKMSANK